MILDDNKRIHTANNKNSHQHSTRSSDNIIPVSLLRKSF